MEANKRQSKSSKASWKEQVITNLKITDWNSELKDKNT